MTTNQPDRLDRIEAILVDVATQQAANTSAIAQLAENTNRVLARSAILDDVLLELRESAEEHRRKFEEHQRNFEEHQRTTNAAIFREACQRADIVGASSHSCRRTALTLMSNVGIPLRVIQEVSGHRNLEQLQKYLEVEPSQVRGALASLSMLPPSTGVSIGKYRFFSNFRINFR